MRIIQNYLPNPKHTEIHRIFVNAKPAMAWQTARHFDGASIPWVRMLFDIRTLPSKLLGKSLPETDRSIGVDQIVKSGTGFMLLHEEQGKEVVVGAIGQFWHLDIPFASVSPEEFRSFNAPGWGKLSWAITVEPYLEGSTISFELRTTATDEKSWNKLNHYYHVIGVASNLMRKSLMAHFESELGKMKLPDDDTRPLPADEIIPDAKYSVTHDTIIEAPRSIVWHYLMQLGCDRAGWYSIDFLDHGNVPSVNHLVKKWTNRKVGDHLAATPAQDSFFEVYQVEHEKYFVIGGEAEKIYGIMKPYKMTWAFILEPIGEDATHLVVRAKMKAAPAWAEWLAGNILYPPIHGLMSAVQLSTIKEYAERDARIRMTPKTTVSQPVASGGLQEYPYNHSSLLPPSIV